MAALPQPPPKHEGRVACASIGSPSYRAMASASKWWLPVCRVLEASAQRAGGFALDLQPFDWGSERYRRTGAFMPADGADQLRAFDAILFGAVGAPDIADHLTLWGLRLAICQPLDQYANVRPTRILPGIRSPLGDIEPGDLDWVIVRENSEGEYAGQGGRSHKGLPEEVATDVSIFTRARGSSASCASPSRRRAHAPRKRLTIVTKSNAQRHGMVLWTRSPPRWRGTFPTSRTTRCWWMP